MTDNDNTVAAGIHLAWAQFPDVELGSINGRECTRYDIPEAGIYKQLQSELVFGVDIKEKADTFSKISRTYLNNYLQAQ